MLTQTATATDFETRDARRTQTANKLRTMLTVAGVIALGSYGTITVSGTARTFDVVIDEQVSILCGGQYERLPSGLTYAQIAAHIAAVAQNETVSAIAQLATCGGGHNWEVATVA